MPRGRVFRFSLTAPTATIPTWQKFNEKSRISGRGDRAGDTDLNSVSKIKFERKLFFIATLYESLFLRHGGGWGRSKDLCSFCFCCWSQFSVPYHNYIFENYLNLYLQNDIINRSPVTILLDNLELLTPVEKLSFWCPLEHPICPWMKIVLGKLIGNHHSTTFVFVPHHWAPIRYNSLQAE